MSERDERAAACRCRSSAERDAEPAPVLGVWSVIAEDLDMVLRLDASRSTRREAMLHAAWQGLALYRIAHRFYERGHRFIPTLLTWVGRVVSGMELHAGASVGRRAFIDHGFGVVIGETCVIGDDVSIYHRVTLGSRGWWQEGEPGERRHPVIGNRVKIGTGASVLGPISVGDDVCIRAHDLVLNDRLSAAHGMEWTMRNVPADRSKEPVG